MTLNAEKKIIENSRKSNKKVLIIPKYREFLSGEKISNVLRVYRGTVQCHVTCL